MTGRRLVSCQQGAVLVIVLFAGSLLIGLLFYLLGLGHALRHGDAFRDAADSAAFSAAVIEARAMNLTALLNIVKLSVVAVSVGLQAVALGALQTIAWIKGRRWRRIAYGWSIPFLVAVELQALNSYSSNQGNFAEVLRAADRAQQALREESSAIAERRASEIAADYDFVDGAFIGPLRPLPTESEPRADFCRRVAPYAGGIANRAFQSVPLAPVKNRARGQALGLITPLCMASGVSSVRLAAGSEMGGEAFQLRAYSVGETIRDNEESGVRVATWRRDEDGGNVARLRRDLSQIGVAQAEFYFAGAAGRADQLWNMDWQARLRRVRVDDGFQAFESGCLRRGGSGACAGVARALRDGQELIIH